MTSSKRRAVQQDPVATQVARNHVADTAVEGEDAEGDEEETRAMTTSHITHTQDIISNNRKGIIMVTANIHSHRKAGNHLRLARVVSRGDPLHHLLDTATRMLQLQGIRASRHMGSTRRNTRLHHNIHSRMVTGAAMEVDHHQGTIGTDF